MTLSKFVYVVAMMGMMVVLITAPKTTLVTDVLLGTVAMGVAGLLGGKALE